MLWGPYGGKDGEIGVQLVNELQLLDCASNTNSEKKDVAFEPGDGATWVFETSAWRGHFGG